MSGDWKSQWYRDSWSLSATSNARPISEKSAYEVHHVLSSVDRRDYCDLLWATVRAQSLDVWIGTGRSSLSRGIYHCRLDSADGKISEATLVAEMEGPGFIEKHPSLPMLYAVGGLDGQPVVACYAVNTEKDKPHLRLIKSLPIGDGGAAHVSLDRTGRTLLTAQYGEVQSRLSHSMPKARWSSVPS